MTSNRASVKEKLGSLSDNKAKLLELLLGEKVKQARTIKPYRRHATRGVVLLPASGAQQRLWLIDQLEGGGAAYHIPMVLRLCGQLDVRALQKSLNDLLQRHEVLRTVFVNDEGEPKQEIAAEGAFSLRIVDLTQHGHAERERQVRIQEGAEAEGRFDLRTGPLIRGRLLRLGVQEHVLIITIHHIVFDGWSMGILIRELTELYAAYREGRENPLRPLPIQYADYSQWQREWLQGDFLAKQIDYWRTQLAGAAPQLELPTDRPRPSVQSYRGENVTVALGPQLSADIKQFAKRHEMTLFMVLLAGWSILLSRLSVQEDVVVGTPVANRQRPELEGLIGFFVNTLVLRLAVQGDARVEDFLHQVKRITLGAYDHQDVPFERVVEALHPQRIPGCNPLFQVMLVVQNAPCGELQLPSLAVIPEEVATLPAKFDLLLALEEQAEQIVGSANFAMDLYDRQTVERWMASYQVVLQGIVHGLGNRIGDLPILSASERQSIESFNATQASVPSNRLIHELFEKRAAHRPDVVAVIQGEHSFSYAELNRKANRLARQLRSHGISPDCLVGICVERSFEMVVGLLGILKAGGAYLPLDPNYPAERLQYMLTDAAPLVVLTQQKLRGLLPAMAARVIVLDAEDLGGNEDNVLAEELGLGPQHLLYVIYTSGSTGRPKGIAMSHGSMVNLVEWQRRELGDGQGRRVLQFAALSFDVSFQETFTTLCNGDTLVLLDEWVRKDMHALTELLCAQAIERLFVPPLMLQSLAEHVTSGSVFPNTLRDVITAGEQLRISPEVTSFFLRLRECRLHNHYGPTETHVVTSLTLTGSPKQWPVFPVIGRPIANTQIYILNAQHQRVPIGVTGEIYIAGAGLARGYLGRPELTAHRFVSNPLDAEPEARMYRTGDLGLWRADGTVEYLGRNDDQVKIRGYRIELGEIEAQLARHELVKEAAVVAREDTPGSKRLVAYVTLHADRGASVDELRAYLKSVLPEYMIPSALVVLDSLPLTPSGKLDRRALPTPELSACASYDYEAPQGQVEEVIGQIWQELLHVDKISRNDNFFEIGGHSLLAIRALFRVNQALGSNLRGVDAYNSPTVRELAEHIQGRTREDEYVDLAREAALANSVVAKPGLPKSPADGVFLTGSTGFVGRFLLAQLLEDTDAIIYCLVRAKSEHQALLRLRTTMTKWDLWCSGFENRIVPVPGDLCLPQLGIPDDTYRMLAQSVDSIFHCATSMNHLETYSMAKQANVGASKELLRLATQCKPKLVNYISTLGIFGSDAKGTKRVVDENTPIEIEKHRSSGGYIASKWVGEKVFMIAGERGIPCNIFRLGLVWADSQQGRYDELQHGYRILKSCLMSGCGIENYGYVMPPTPVDYAARAVIGLADRHRRGKGIFHISSGSTTIDGVFERCNEIAGTALELMPLYDWTRRVKQLHYEGRSLPIVPLIEYSFSMDEATFYEHQHRRPSNVRFDCSRTHRELENVGIVTPALDDNLLRLCLSSMYSRDAELRASAQFEPTRCAEQMTKQISVP